MVLLHHGDHQDRRRILHEPMRLHDEEIHLEADESSRRRYLTPPPLSTYTVAAPSCHRGRPSEPDVHRQRDPWVSMRAPRPIGWHVLQRSLGDGIGIRLLSQGPMRSCFLRGLSDSGLASRVGAANREVDTPSVDPQARLQLSSLWTDNQLAVLT